MLKNPPNLTDHAASEAYGWQVAKEKFLWSAGASETPLKVIRTIHHNASSTETNSGIDEVQASDGSLPMIRWRLQLIGGRKRQKIEKRDVHNAVTRLRSLQHKHLLEIIGSYPDEAPKCALNVLFAPVPEHTLSFVLEFNKDPSTKRNIKK